MVQIIDSNHNSYKDRNHNIVVLAIGLSMLALAITLIGNCGKRCKRKNITCNGDDEFLRPSF